MKTTMKLSFFALLIACAFQTLKATYTPFNIRIKVNQPDLIALDATNAIVRWGLCSGNTCDTRRYTQYPYGKIASFPFGNGSEGVLNTFGGILIVQYIPSDIPEKSGELKVVKYIKIDDIQPNKTLVIDAPDTYYWEEDTIKLQTEDAN